jgi:hypothetical protein
MDPSSLDMMIVIVVVTETFFAKIGVFEGVLMGRVTAATGDEDVEFVCGIGVGVEKVD